MTPDEITEWVEIIYHSFTEDEIEHLESFAEWGFEMVENKQPFTLAPVLILDALKEHKKTGGDADEGKNG